VKGSGDGLSDELRATLRALRSDNEDVRLAAYSSLRNKLSGEGTRIEASAKAVPYIIDVVADPNAPTRFMACFLLVSIAIGDEFSWLSDSQRLDRLRYEVARKAAMTDDELERELAEWVAAGLTERDRMERKIRAEWTTALERRDFERWELEAYEAVRGGLPVYLEALASEDVALSMSGAYLLGWFPEDAVVIVPHLAQLLARERDRATVATASIAAGLLGDGRHAGLTAALTQRLGSPHAVERWAAAIALAHLSSEPGPVVVRELYDCVRHADRWPFEVPYLSGDMASVAVLSLTRLSEAAAPDRLDVLMDRLMTLQPGPSALLVGRSILDVAFPHGRLPEGTTFAALSPEQRKVVVALNAGRASGGAFWLTHLSQHYGLPADVGLPKG
jgi:HEAT repeat protein